MSKTDRVEVDHTPGGSPEGKSAAAPLIPVVNIRREMGMSDDVQFSGEMVEAEHVLKMARAAAATGLRNADRYSGEDRADAAADAVSRIMRDSGRYVRRCRCGAPATHSGYVLRKLTARGWTTTRTARCLRHSGELKSRRPVLRFGGIVPASSATFTHCLHAVANYRRSIDAQRQRDAVEAAGRALEDFTLDPRLEEIEGGARPDLYGSPMGAYWTASDMLKSAGLADVPTASALWTLAYASARAAAPDRETGAHPDSKMIGAELDLSPATVRQHCKRAAAKLAGLGFTPDQWLDALDVRTTALYARKGSAAPLPPTARGDDVDSDWRTSPAQRVANTGVPAPLAGKVTETASAWLASTVQSDGRADWTAYLNGTSDARLSKVASIRQSERRARTETERTAIRQAAGLR